MNGITWFNPLMPFVFSGEQTVITVPKDRVEEPEFVDFLDLVLKWAADFCRRRG